MSTLRTAAASLVALSCLTAAARQLTPDEALSRLQASEASRIKAASPQAQPKLVATGRTADGDAAYYVFAAGNRTIFASADDVAAPLLGYSDNAPADMDEMPPAMRWWLDQYAREIAWANANGVAAYTSRTGAFDDFPLIAPLVETAWDQRSPYNDLCPTIDGQSTATGCAATAMAQAMAYHRYPAVGTGTVSYEWEWEENQYQTLSMDLSTAPLAWDDILNTYTAENPGSEAQRQAVATLMKACGYSINMQYGTGESGTNAAFIPGALVNHFGYDAATRYEYRDFYTLDEWEKMMHDNLINVGPIVYAGIDNKYGGHAFVCDGYSGDGYFHINWGWSGAGNGEFLLSALDVSPYSFNSDQGAVLGMRPPQSGSEPEPYIGCLEAIGAFVYERTVTIPMQFGNLGSQAGTFTLGFMLVSDDDSEDEPIYITSENAVDVYLMPVLEEEDECSDIIVGEIPASISAGDYKVYPTYRLGDGEWKKVKLHYYEPQYIVLSVTDAGIEISPEYVTPYLKFYDHDRTQLTYGEPYTIALAMASFYPVDIEANVVAALIDVESEEVVKILGTQTADVSHGEDNAVEIDGILSDDITPGVYSILATEVATGAYYTIDDVEVTVPLSSEDISSDAASGSDTRWYDLTGTPVDYEPQAPGIYVKVSGGKAEKVMVK